ncbi:MAG: FtsB family cell division protein [Flavobacteriaceae bacterium]
MITSFFIIWMFFFDSNSVLIQWQLSSEIKDLEQEKNYLETEIARDKALLKKFSDSIEKERFAREHYFFKKPNEDIFIIEMKDSLPKNK